MAKETQEKTEMKNGRVLVTTEYRGIFCGDLKKDDEDNATVTLTNARMCVYFSRDVKGVLGLAATGPTSGCRIGKAVPSIRLPKVTALIDCTAEAAKAWDGAPWG